jgi:bifunctional DNA-binding transcriptional regulator/antitoxin component of YhaV-PrlF toxin-antitoxin module
MEVLRISKGGQISIPARIRKRWGVQRLIVDDRGDRLVVIPLPDDPLKAARGMFKGPGPTSDEMRSMAREEEAAADSRKWGDAR